MDLRLFQYFLAVVREENITRAADLLHITQPTLSRQMAQLEDELGVKLFIRGKHLELTEAGMKLRHKAEEVVFMIERIKSEFNEQDELSGTISIGTGGLASFQVMPHIMESFKNKYPDVDFEIYTNNADFIRERLDHGSLDFGLLLEPIDITKYNYIRMQKKECWGLLLSTNNPLSKKTSISKEDLLNTPLIVSNRLAIQKELTLWLKEDIANLNILATYNLITNVTQLVSQGVASALTLEGAVNLFEGDTLTFLPLSPALEMTSVLAWKKFNPFFTAAEKFLEHFKENCPE